MKQDSSDQGLMPITTGIHPFTRNILSKLHYRGKREFMDRAMEADHPFVDRGVRKEIYRLDKGLVAVWELQGDGEPRWHLFRHWSPGKLDIPTHFMLLSDMGRYVPLDWAAVEMVRVALEERDPVKFVEKFLDRENRARGMMMVTKDGPQAVGAKDVAETPAFRDGNPIVTREQYEHADELRRYYRRLFKRNSWGSVGSCWERGSELPWMNITPAHRNEV